jgi:hypothetical protein
LRSQAVRWFADPQLFRLHHHGFEQPHARIKLQVGAEFGKIYFSRL